MEKVLNLITVSGLMFRFNISNKEKDPRAAFGCWWQNAFMNDGAILLDKGRQLMDSMH